MLLLFVDDIVYPSYNSPGEDVNEALPSDDKVHIKDMKAAFFRKTWSNELDKNGQLKKLSRIFKNKHACFYRR